MFFIFTHFFYSFFYSFFTDLFSLHFLHCYRLYYTLSLYSFNSDTKSLKTLYISWSGVFIHKQEAETESLNELCDFKNNKHWKSLMFSFMLRVCVTVVNMKREQCSAFNHSAIIVIIYIDFRTSVACSCLVLLSLFSCLLSLFFRLFVHFSTCFAFMHCSSYAWVFVSVYLFSYYCHLFTGPVLDQLI